MSGKSELPHAVIMIGTTREKPVKLRTRTGESINAMQLSLVIRGWGLPEQLVNVGRREPSPSKKLKIIRKLPKYPFLKP